MNNLPKPLYYLVVIAIGLGAYFGGRYIMQAVLVKRDIDKAYSRSTNPSSAPVVSIDELRKEFNTGCLAVDYSGTQFDQNKYCTCIFDALEKEKGANWIITAGLNANDQNVQNEILPYATECIRQQNINV